MMHTMLLALALLQSVPPDSQSDALAFSKRTLASAMEEELKGSDAEARKRYAEVCETVEKALEKEQNSPNAAELRELGARAALRLASILESQPADLDPKNTIESYELAIKLGGVRQKTLAANNLAALYWRRKDVESAKTQMANINYDDPGLSATERSFYLDNYARILENYGHTSTSPAESEKVLADAAQRYKAALLSSPNDDTALDGVERLVGQGVANGDQLAAEAAGYLVQKHYAKNAVHLAIRALESGKQLPDESLRSLMRTVIRAYAVSTVQVAEFTADQPEFEKIKVQDKRLAPLLDELSCAISGRFAIAAEPGTQPVRSNSCESNGGPPGALLTPQALDRALASRFETPEYRAAARLFPAWMSLGESHSLSLVLKAAADELRQTKATGDESQQINATSVVANKYAAAWVLDPSNTFAALELAGLYKSERLPQPLLKLVKTDINHFYEPTQQRLSALYREPSQRQTLDLSQEEIRNVRQVYGLIEEREKEKAVAARVQRPSEQAVLTIQPPRRGDRFVRGVAPSGAEAVSVETIRSHAGSKCGTTKPNQFALATTDLVTGSFAAPLPFPLSEGELVCVYEVHNGVRSASSSVATTAAPVLFIQRVHNYLAAGAYGSNVGGEPHAVPRASWTTDISLGRWGYEGYQDGAGRGHSMFTALANVYAEAGATSVPKATVTHPTGSGLASVGSLELGAYAPLFTRRTTWWFRNDQRAFFVSPLIKGGIDFLPGGDTNRVLAAGARVGVLRLAHSATFAAPDLQSYIDVVYGNNSNVIFNPQTNSVTQLHQVDCTGMLKIPETPFYLGFKATAGPGPKQTGVFAGVRIEFERLIHQLPF
jgi:hypothetical protein